MRPNAGLMLGQRRRRCTKLKQTLGQRLVFAGKLRGTLSSSSYHTIWIVEDNTAHENQNNRSTIHHYNLV